MLSKSLVGLCEQIALYKTNGFLVYWENEFHELIRFQYDALWLVRP